MILTILQYHLLLYLAYALSGAFLLVTLCALSRTFRRCALDTLALLNALLKKEDELESLKRVSASTRRLTLSLLLAVLATLLSLGVAFLPIAAVQFLEFGSFDAAFLYSFEFLLAFSIGALLPFAIARGRKKDPAYSESSKLLHRMVLNHYEVAKWLFSIDSRFKKGSRPRPREEFVVVTGLARSGTTSLMYRLSDFDCFSSLSYSNMPFILSPNLWKKFYSPKMGEKKERGHRDGVLIGLNSVEALDEFFFKAHLDDAFIEKDDLIEHELDRDIHGKFLEYQSLVRRNDESLYLTKNNNFLLRYRSLRKWNSAFTLFLLFRDPLSHAHSLLDQHRRFSAMQEENPFVLEYMNWLGHHEFGLGQRPFKFSKHGVAVRGDKSGLDYWIRSWINYYSFALTLERGGLRFVDYDEFCRRPKHILESILRVLDLDLEVGQREPFHNRRSCKESFDEQLYEEASRIHAALKELVEPEGIG